MTIKPVARDGESAEFFDALRRGELLLRRRPGSEDYFDPRTATTDAVGLEYVPAGGGGKVVSWAVAHGVDASSGEPTRTVLGIVELDEGPWWWCQLVDVDYGAVLTGLRVQVGFATSGTGPGDEMVPVFGPVTNGDVA